ncbi:MAG: aminotransferase class V-fold PLP-dependent enzyme [Bacteroidota bacterium]
MERRNFLQRLSLAAAPYLAPGLSMALLERIQTYSHKVNSVEDEEFWRLVRQAYTVSPGLINLNNAGLSPQTRKVQEAEIRYIEYANEAPSFYMWRIIDAGREPVRKQLARLAGVEADEIAMNRNATEALDTIIFGLDLKKGDEVVLCKQDYPLMIHAWNQRAQREGIELKWVDIPDPIEDKEVLIKAYTSLFTKKTKILHLTHQINWTGQILPAKELTKLAHARGIKVVLDAAQSFAQMPFSLKELDVDYAGTSLHKWLGAPFGTGMLYVKKDLISALWPLFPTDEPQSDDIRKFENLGTRSTAAEMAIGHAVEFHEWVGGQRKWDRIQYLKRYWVEKALDIPGFELHSSLKPEFGGAITNFSLKEKDVVNIYARLSREYRIHVSPVIWDGIKGIRATPNIYTMTEELDRLVEALANLAK